MRRNPLLHVALLVLGFLSFGGCESMTGRSTGEYMDDASITTKVKSKLTGEKASNFTRIDVDTKAGTVYLTGVVKDQETKDHAEQLARQVSGVKEVVDNLVVRSDDSSKH